MYRKYLKYKDSGICFIGQIPERWNIKRIKFFARTLVGGTPSTSELDYWNGTIPWIPSGKLQNCDIYNADEFITESGLRESATKLLPKDTTVLALTGATCSNIGYLKFSTTANQSVVGIINNSEAMSRFLFYYLISQREQILSERKGGAQSGINEKDVRNIVTLVPKLDEQKTIIYFLEDKIAQVDDLIAKKERMIELLKEERAAIINQAVTKGLDPKAEMKDSGIEWLGNVPKHWKIKRLKYIVKPKLEYGANEVAELDDIELPRYIRITDFDEDGNLRQDTFRSLPEEQAKDYLLCEGDVLFARSGATVGKTFQFKDYTGKACFAGYLIKARPNQELLLSDFLYYFTRSNAYENWKNSIFNQATIQNIGADKYAVLPLPLPSVIEQNGIVKLINHKTVQIDKQVALEQKSIELLKEFRTALISEVVTGKIDVRNYSKYKEGVTNAS